MTAELTPEEIAYLATDTTCGDCPHRKIFHDYENDDCLIPGCACDRTRFLREHEGHNLAHHAGGGTRGPHVGWGFSIQPPYIECRTCRTSLATPAAGDAPKPQK